MTTETEHNLKAGRRQIARSRGALSGVLLIVLGAWAALVPFIGPYFDIGLSPNPDSAWHWTSGRGLYQLLPGAVAAFAGLLIVLSASRATTLLAGWLGTVSGAWLVVAPSLAGVIGVGAGSPDPTSGDASQAAQALLHFYGTGAAILAVAAVALGRLSVHSVRDVRAAERRADHEAAQEAEQQRRRDDDERLAEQQRRNDDERLAEQQRRVEADRHAAGQAADASLQHQSQHQPQHQPQHQAQPQHSEGEPPAGGYGPPLGPAQGPPQGPPPQR